MKARRSFPEGNESEEKLSRGNESTSMPFREEKAADETPLPYKKSPRERFP